MKRKRFIILLNAFLLILIGICSSVNTQSNEQAINVASGKPVEVSSAWNDTVWNSSFLTDGLCMKSWPLPSGETLGWRTAPGFTDRNVDITLKMNLVEKCLIEKITLYPRGNGGICFPDDYTIEVSPDGNSWTKVADVKNDTEVAEKPREFTFNKTEASYIRIHISKLAEELDGFDLACELSEIEVWGIKIVDESIKNVAKGQLVSCTSAYSDSVWKADYLLDGDVMGSWPLPSGRTLGWRSAALPDRNTEVSVTITLSDVVQVNEIVLYPRGNGGICFPDDYRIEVSTDNVTWKVVADIKGDTKVAEEKRSCVFESQEVKYIKVIMTKASEEKDGFDIAYEISEIEVWGKVESKLKLNKKEIWMSIGEQDKILPFYEDASTQSEYEFDAIDKAVVSVDTAGNIKALKDGDTTVKVRNKVTGDECSCKIKVLKEKDKNILITVPVWGNSKAITEEQFKMLRDADIDIAMAVGHDLSQELTLKMLDTARKIWTDESERNLRVMIHSYIQGITPASTDEEILEYVEKYRNTPALAGYHIEDEPFDPNPYARIERLLKENDPDSIADINFLPGLVYISYDEFMNRLSDYCKLVGEYTSYLSYDNYPFGLAKGSVDELGLFGNYESLRKVSLENNVPTTVYIQGVGTEKFGYRRPDENQLRYHIASAMAYGFKSIKYYSWFVPGADGTGESDLYTNAIMDKDCNKTDLYDSAAKLNKQIHNVGNVLVNLKAIEVYHSGSKSSNSIYEKVTDNFVAQPIGDCYSILSLMVDESNGKQYLMIVNKDFENKQTMSFKLNNVESVYELDKDNVGGTLTSNYSGGVITREFLPGEFALIKLSDNVDHRSITDAGDSKNVFRDAYVRADGSDTSKDWSINKLNDGIKFSVSGAFGWRKSNDTVSDSTLFYDMHDIKKLNRIDIYPAGIGVSCGNQYPENIVIYASEDGADWQKVFEQSDITRPTYDVPVFRFDTVSARYVKVVFTDTIGTAVSEIEAYFDSGEIPLPEKTSYQKPQTKPDMNIAKDKSVKSSHSYNDNVWNPSNATDGVIMQSWPTDKTLGWCGGFYDTTDTNVWLQVDLEAYYKINKVILYPRGNGGICFPEDYEIQVSDNGIDWTTVYTKTGDTNIGEKERIIEFSETTAKYVRLFVTKLSSDLDGAKYSCQISEIEVYNTNIESNPKTSDSFILNLVSLILVIPVLLAFFKRKIYTI